MYGCICEPCAHCVESTRPLWVGSVRCTSLYYRCHRQFTFYDNTFNFSIITRPLYVPVYCVSQCYCMACHLCKLWTHWMNTTTHHWNEQTQTLYQSTYTPYHRSAQKYRQKERMKERKSNQGNGSPKETWSKIRRSKVVHHASFNWQMPS